MFPSMEIHGPWIFCIKESTCFLNICHPIKIAVSKWPFWIKLVHFVAEILHNEFCIFLKKSTIWPVQLQINKTTGAAFPHIANMFTRGIYVMVAPSLIQLSPNIEASLKTDSLFSHALILISSTIPEKYQNTNECNKSIEIIRLKIKNQIHYLLFSSCLESHSPFPPTLPAVASFWIDKTWQQCLKYFYNERGLQSTSQVLHHTINECH